MAFIKNSVIMALVAFFGLEVSAAPRPQDLDSILNSIPTMPSFTMIPVSTLSETTFVPVMPSVQPLSTSTATINDASVIITSSTTVVPVTITPSTSTSTLYVAPPETVHDITTAYLPRPTSIGETASWIQVQLPANFSAIGATCLSKEIGRPNEIRDCLLRSDHEQSCDAFNYSCQCYYLGQAGQCYKKHYNDCKRDGMFSALTYAEGQACEYATKAGIPKFTPKASNLNSYTTITTKLP